jgi:DNA-binding Lrp family transcriptional regulator
MENRQQAILDQIEQGGSCSYDELAKRLGVSTMTVRREVDELARRGALIRIVGGVQKAQAPSYLYETAVHSRLVVLCSAMIRPDFAPRNAATAARPSVMALSTACDDGLARPALSGSAVNVSITGKIDFSFNVPPAFSK